mmetsp:Transcript_48228/g.114265  ORF Transcript_48228/g.114265 Transcript_48228/m.114265 type:complete len:230 (-) Transcript_48228:2027-2716(-)
MHGSTLVIVRQVRVDSVFNQRADRVQIAVRCGLTHRQRRVHADDLAAAVSDELLHTRLVVPHSILERSAHEAIARVDVGFVLEQIRDDVHVAFAGCEMQRRALVIVGVVDHQPIVDQPLHRLQVSVERSLAQLHRAHAAVKLDFRPRLADQRADIVVLVPHRVVHWRVPVDVLDRRVGPELQQQPHHIQMPLRTRDVQRRPLARVRVVHAHSAADQLLQLLAVVVVRSL